MYSVKLCFLFILVLTDFGLPAATNEWFSQEVENVSSNIQQCNCEDWQLFSNVTNYLTHNSMNWSCTYGVETRTYRCNASSSNICKYPKVTKRYYLPQKRCSHQNPSKYWMDKTDPCSKTCGGGLRTNFRVCYSNADTAKSSSTTHYCKVRNVPCNGEPCKVPLVTNVYKWTWIVSECSVTCYDGRNSGRVVAQRQCIKTVAGGKDEVVAHNMCTSRMDNQSMIYNCSGLLPCSNPTLPSSLNNTEATHLSKQQDTTQTEMAIAPNHPTKEFQTTQNFVTTITSEKPTKRRRTISFVPYGFVLACCLFTLGISMLCAGLVSYYCFGWLERKRAKLQRRGRSMEISSPIPSTLAIGRHSTNALQVLNNTIPINQNSSTITLQSASKTTSTKTTQWSLRKDSFKRQNGGSSISAHHMSNESSSTSATPNGNRLNNLDGIYDVCCARNALQNTTGGRYSPTLLSRQQERGSVSSTVYLTPSDAAAENPSVGAEEQGDGPPCPPSYSDVQSIVNLGPPPPIPVTKSEGSFTSQQSPSANGSNGRTGYKDIMENLTKVLSELQDGAEKRQTSQLPRDINQQQPTANELNHIYDEVFDSGKELNRGQAREINGYPRGTLGQTRPPETALSDLCPCNGMQTIYATVQRK